MPYMSIASSKYLKIFELETSIYSQILKKEVDEWWLTTTNILWGNILCTVFTNQFKWASIAIVSDFHWADFFSFPSSISISCSEVSVHIAVLYNNTQCLFSNRIKSSLAENHATNDIIPANPDESGHWKR